MLACNNHPTTSLPIYLPARMRLFQVGIQVGITTLLFGFQRHTYLVPTYRPVAYLVATLNFGAAHATPAASSQVVGCGERDRSSQVKFRPQPNPTQPEMHGRSDPTFLHPCSFLSDREAFAKSKTTATREQWLKAQIASGMPLASVACSSWRQARMPSASLTRR